MRALLVWLRILSPRMVFVNPDAVNVGALQASLGGGYKVVSVQLQAGSSMIYSQFYVNSI